MSTGLIRVGRMVVMGAALVALAACSDPGPGTVNPYDRAPVPPVPNRTAEVAADGDMTDGEYWAIISGADSGEPSPTVTFTLMQASFDAAGGVEVEDDPSRTVVVAIDMLRSLSVVARSGQNYAVPAEELVSLVLGNEPAADAPDDYSWVEYPFLLTVRDGAVVEARQIWLEALPSS